MSIVCYAGLTGHGKSYSAVENFVIPALKEGRHVAHNLQLFPPALSVVCDRDVTPLLHQIAPQATPAEVMAGCPDGAVIVLDEVWEYWAKGLKINDVPKDELRFFRKHRHSVGEDGIASEMCLIAHSPTEDLPAFIRSIVDLTYIHEKHTSVGAKGRFRVDVYQRCQSAEKPTKSKLIRKLQGAYRPEVWNCYISHTNSKATALGEAGLEKMPDGRASVFKSFTFRSAIAGAVMLPFAFWFAASAFNGMTVKPKPAKVVSPAHTPVPAPQIKTPQQYIALAEAANGAAEPPRPAAPTAMPKPTATPYSAKWRVVGGAMREDGTGSVLLVSATGPQRINASRCAMDDQREWTCPMEDGIATYFSGGGGSDQFSAAVAPGSMQDTPALAHSDRAMAGGV